MLECFLEVYFKDVLNMKLRQKSVLDAYEAQAIRMLKGLSRLKKSIGVREKRRQVIEFGETYLLMIQHCRRRTMIAQERIEEIETLEAYLQNWIGKIDCLLNEAKAGEET